MKTLEYLRLTGDEKLHGVYIRGNEHDREYKWWYSNGNLYEHYLFKNGKIIKIY